MAVSHPLFLAALALLATAALVSGNSFKEDVNQCKTTTKYQPERSPKDSKEAKCFAACIMEKKGVVTTKGDILPDKLMEKYQKRLSDRPQQLQKLKTILNDCKTQAAKVTDKCERVYSFKECSNTKVKEGNVFSRFPAPDSDI